MCESWKCDPGGLDDAALAELVVEVQAEADRLEAWRLRVLGEWDARAVWAADGACNGASWLAALGNVARAHMSGLLHDARRLRGMPVTAAAVADGGLASAKARLLARAVNDRTREAFGRDEQTLVDTIARLTVDEAAQVIRWWQRLADEDGPDPRDRDANTASVSQRLNGRWRIDGDVDVESGTIFYGVLAGLVDAARRALRAQGVDVTGMGPRLRADALVEMARRCTAANDTTAAARPLVWVIAGAEQLRTGKGVCELAGGGAIPAVTAQRLACDCDFANVIVDPDDHRFNLGRTQRSANGAQRRLLWVRDGGCTFPGCDRPAGWCEAHHITFWDDQGPTDLDNLTLLCSHHHHLCHEGGYRLQRDDDDHLVFHRPDGTTLHPPLITA